MDVATGPGVTISLTEPLVCLVAGLLVAAFVPPPTNGVEKSEAEVLKAIGKAAGLSADKVKTIVKRATDLGD